MKKIKAKYDDVTLKVLSYRNNGRLAIFSYGSSGDSYADVTINLDYMINDIDEGFINGDVDQTLVDNLKKCGIIQYSYGFINYNYGKYEFVKFDLDKLKEYDKFGIDNFFIQAENNYSSIIIGNKSDINF